MTSEQLSITKNISGFFYPQDLRIEQIKGEFFNKVKDICQIEGDLQFFQLSNLYILKSPEKPNLEIRMTDSHFNYENTYSTDVDFIDTSLQLADSWKQISECTYTKAGGVLALIVTDIEEIPIDFFKKYIKNIPLGNELIASKLHFNYSDEMPESMNPLNVNLSIDASSQLTIKLDINELTNNQDGITVEYSKIILENLFKYKDSKLIDMLNAVE